MKLVYSAERDRYEFSLRFMEDYEFQRALRIIKAAGFRWEADTKKWYAQADTAVGLIRYADDNAKIRLSKNSEEVERALADSRATDADIDIPVPDGEEYLPFQRAGIKYATRRKNTLIGDEMGLGKTIQALGYMNTFKRGEIKQVLVIVPATIKLNWKREAEKWLVYPYEIGIGRGKKVPTSPLLIINWDILTRSMSKEEKKIKKKIKWIKKHEISLEHLPALDKELSALKKERLTTPRPELIRDWDLIIADEAHMAKNYKSQRTRMLKMLCARSERALLLTGTPLLNRPIELWTLLNCLDPGAWPNRFKFAQRYCGAHMKYGHWDFTGSSNEEELQIKLRSTVLIRRLKKDVLKELPPKTRSIIHLDQDDYIDVLGIERTFENKWKDDLVTLSHEKDLARANEDHVEYKNAVSKLQEAKSIHFQEMAKVRHDTAMAKVKDVATFVEQLLESADKVIVFAHHHDVIDALRESLNEYNPIWMDGRIPAEGPRRQAIVDAFQGDPTIRVYIGGILLSTGITLTESSTVVFAELDWVPGNISQAEDRSHRIGQIDNVLVYHVVVDGSIDSRLAKTVVNKQRVIDKVLDDTPEAKAIKLELSEEDVREPKKKEEFIDRSTLEEKTKMLGMMVQLSRACDGASTIDGMGFNKIDARFGHSLAESESFTDKQAHFAKKILKKYKGQLDGDDYKIIYGQ